jgi:hypothetical protein
MMSFHKRSVSPFVFSRVLLRMYDEDNPPFWRLFFAPPLIDSFRFSRSYFDGHTYPPQTKKGDSSRPTLPDVWLPTNFLYSNVFCVLVWLFVERRLFLFFFPPLFFVLCAHHFRSLALVIALTARAAEWLRPCPRWIY